MYCSSIPGSNGGVSVSSDNCFDSAAISRRGTKATRSVRAAAWSASIWPGPTRVTRGPHRRVPPLDPLRPQPDVDQICALAADHHRNVARVEEGLALAELCA